MTDYAKLGRNARITYWYDSVSDDPAWCVDIEDDEGSQTLSTHDSDSEARQEAVRQAARRGLDCCLVNGYGKRIAQ